MKRIIVWILVFSFLFVTGCVQSLHPIYTDQDIIFDESILGTWQEDGTPETWTLWKAGKSEYRLSHIDSDGQKGNFSARLVKVSGELFLDITPLNPGFIQNGFYRDHFLKTHSFVHVRKVGPSVSVAVLESKWLKDLLADKPNAIGHVQINDEIILTSSTKETQKFLLDNLNTAGAFSQPSVLTRWKCL